MPDSYKFLDNIGKKLLDTGLGNECVLDMAQKAQVTKTKSTNRTSNSNLLQGKNLKKKLKGNLWNGTEYMQAMYQIRS